MIALKWLMANLTLFDVVFANERSMNSFSSRDIELCSAGLSAPIRAHNSDQAAPKEADT